MSRARAALGPRCAGLALAILLAGCAANPPPLPAPERIPAPDPGQVERVLFLVGDPGKAHAHSSPLLARLQQDIEWWAQRLQGDSTVALVMLGDLLYPLGLHPPDTPEFPGDSAILMDQVMLFAGPNARARGARGYFLAGNHDWGLEKEWEGYVRLKRLDEFLQAARARTGADVLLVPKAGTGGPYVVDWGRRMRLLLLDTAWWLAGTEEPEQDQVLARIDSAMATAGDREVLIAAHHPFKSAGPHGGAIPFWKTLGVQYVLSRSGALLQNLTSQPYRRLEYGLRSIFARRGPPLAFVGGHEHSLQVLAGTERTDPTYSIVSGSASKISHIGGLREMHFGSATPGYMRLLVERDGDITLFVEAAPEEYLACPEGEEERQRCMQEGMAAFKVVHSQRLR